MITTLFKMACHNSIFGEDADLRLWRALKPLYLQDRQISYHRDVSFYSNRFSTAQSPFSDECPRDEYSIENILHASLACYEWFQLQDKKTQGYVVFIACEVAAFSHKRTSYSMRSWMEDLQKHPSLFRAADLLKIHVMDVEVAVEGTKKQIDAVIYSFLNLPPEQIIQRALRGMLESCHREYSNNGLAAATLLYNEFRADLMECGWPLTASNVNGHPDEELICAIENYLAYQTKREADKIDMLDLMDDVIGGESVKVHSRTTVGAFSLGCSYYKQLSDCLSPVQMALVKKHEPNLARAVQLLVKRNSRKYGIYGEFTPNESCAHNQAREWTPGYVS